MENVLRFVIEAQNKATETIKQVQSQLSGIEKKAKDMKPAFKEMATAGTVAFGALTAAVGLSVKAFQDQEIVETKLETLLKNTTNATDEQINSLKEQASALQNVGVIGDDVTIALQAQLATFELNTETIKKMTPAILDMVVAEKGVNATTEDMISFGNAFGMAMEGNYAALTNRGFKIDENTKKIIELGTEEQKATAITEYLNSVYEGTNEAMKNTSAGGMKALQNSFGDLQEEIGEVFIPLLVDIVGKITPVVEEIGKWIQQNPELTKNITILTAAIAGIIAVIGTLGLAIPNIITGFKAFGAILSFIMSPIGLVVVAIAGLIAAGVLLWKNWDEISSKATVIWNNISNFMKGILKGISDFIYDCISFWLGLIEMFLNVFGLSIKDIQNAIENMMTHIKNIFSIVSKEVSGIWNGLWDGIKSIVDSAVNFMKPIIDSFIGWFQDKFDIIGDIVSNVRSAMENVGSMIGGAVSSVSNIGKSTLGGFQFGTDYVPRTGMYMLHKGEAVSPAGAGNSIVVNINGGYYMSERAAEDIGDKIIEKLKREVRL